MPIEKLTTNSIASEAITTDKIAAGAVVNADISDGVITGAKLADTTVTAAKLHTTAVTDKLGYTPVNKAGDTMTGSLNLNGYGSRDTSGSGKVYNNLTPLYDFYSNGNTAGALVVNTSIPHNGNMCSITISGYSYITAQAWEIKIGVYFGENNLYSVKAMSLGHPFSTIRLAKRDSNGTLAIILGETNVVYGTSIIVDQFLQNYTAQVSTNADGWTISRVTSLSGYSLTTTAPNEIPSKEIAMLLATSTSAENIAIVSNNSGYQGWTSVNNGDSSVFEANSTGILIKKAGWVYVVWHNDITTTGTSNYITSSIEINGITWYQLISNTNGQWDGIVNATARLMSANTYIRTYVAATDITALDAGSWSSLQVLWKAV